MAKNIDNKNIDNKIVEMQFNNKNFEQNAQTSLGTLAKLKNSLNMGDAIKGFSGLDRAVKDVDLDSFEKSVDSVSRGFSALEVMAVTALVNITNSAVNAGKRILKALTIDQVSAGYSKYEEKVEAVQTIMNATGLSIEEVTEQLDKLSWFTDETSYNFTDMVNSLGKFTSAGIELDTSVTAMMGIANWAATSGVNSQEASIAYYALSQAMGQGSVKLRQWQSLAAKNMTTEEFRDTIVDTAIAMGELVRAEDGVIKTTKGTIVNLADMEYTLHEGWLSTEVMMSALDRYGNYTQKIFEYVEETGVTAAEAMRQVSDAGMELGAKSLKAAQQAKTLTDAVVAVKDAIASGWADTFELIFGNYEEAVELWSDIADYMWDVFASGKETRNELLSTWKELGGRDDLIEAFWNLTEAMEALIAPLKEAFRAIFPATTAETLARITSSFKDFTERLTISDETADRLKRTFTGLFSVLDSVKFIFTSFFKALKPAGSELGSFAEVILEITAKVGDFLLKINTFIRESETLQTILKGIGSVISWAIGFVGGLVKALGKLFGLVQSDEKPKALINISGLLKGIGKIMSSVGNAAIFMRDLFVKAIGAMADALSTWSLSKALGKVWEVLKKIASFLGTVFKSVLNVIKNIFKDFSFDKLIDLLKVLAGGAVGVGITKSIMDFASPFKAFGQMFQGVTDILDSVRKVFAAYANSINAKALMTVAQAILILVAAIVVLTFVDPEKLYIAIGAITMLFMELITALALMKKVGGRAGGMSKVSVLMLTLSTAVLILALALRSIATLDQEAMYGALLIIGGLMTMLIVAIKAINKLDSKKVMKGATQLILLAIAIRILASSVSSLAKLSWDEMMRGLIGLTFIMGALLLFLHNVKVNKKSISTAAGLLILSVAIRILASSVKTLGKMSWEDMARGLVGVALLLAAIAGFTKIIGSPKRLISAGIAMILIGTALRIITSSVSILGEMSWENLGRGLLAIAGMLVILVGALKILPKNILLQAVAITILAVGLRILASSISALGGLSWTELLKGLGALGLILAGLAIALRAMKGTIGAAASLFLASAALIVLAGALFLISRLSWGSLAKGLITIAALFVILGVAGALLAPLTPVILALAGAIALLGVGILAIGLGFVALGAGLSAIAAGIYALAVIGPAAIDQIVKNLTSLIVGLVVLIPLILTELAKGIVAFLIELKNMVPPIIQIVWELLKGLVEMLRDMIPPILQMVFEALMEVIRLLVENMPAIVKALMSIIVAILNGVADALPQIIDAAARIVMAFMDGITRKLPDIIQKAFEMVISFIYGLAEAIDENTPIIIDAVQTLMFSLLNAAVLVLTGGIINLKEIGGKLMNSGLVQGIKDKFTAMKDTLFSGVKKAADALGGVGKEFVNVGKNIIKGIIEGIFSGAKKIWDAISSLGSSALELFKKIFGIESPSKVFAEYGKYIDLGLAEGLLGNKQKVEDATEEVGDTAVDTMRKAMTRVAALANSEISTDPTIRPVMDLSEIQNGTRRMHSMLNDFDGYGVSGSVDLANRTAFEMGRRNMGIDGDTSSALAKLTKTLQGMMGSDRKIENTFHITGDNPQEIAEEVSQIIYRQINRKETVWA